MSGGIVPRWATTKRSPAVARIEVALFSAAALKSDHFAMALDAYARSLS
jgi:hypothetical protein